MSSYDYKQAIQAAGHDGAMESANGELFLKPTTQQELDFYNSIADNEDLLDITCKYMGILTEQALKEEFSGDTIEQSESNKETTTIQLNDIQSIVQEAEKNQDLTKIHTIMTSTKSFTLVLENASHGFTQPCILDAKLGSQLWDETMSLDKRERMDQVSNATISGPLGVRIAGMSLYNPKTKERIWYDKQYGRKMTEDDVVEGFSELFFDREYFLAKKVDNTKSASSLIEAEKKRVLSHHIKEELEHIYTILSETELRMISASVLIIYEGDEESFEEKLIAGNSMVDNDKLSINSSDSEQQIPVLFKIKLIDFAHSKLTPGLGPDENSLKGLQSLIKIFSELEQWYENID